MIDLHIHSIFSDGVLIPSEIVSRAKQKGYKALALTDHVDTSNIDFVLSGMVKVSRDLSLKTGVKVVPGVEITHVPPSLIGGLVTEARERGAGIVIVHGETIVEPVPPGTNREAIIACADILAHPGLITEEDAMLAAKNGVFLEITSRGGHSYTNGHIVRMARRTGAELIFNTDAHGPGDFIDKETARAVLEGAGLLADDVSLIFENSANLIDKRG
ncbi:MAG: histidinol phosphate phosphatase domain-containing protein [Deltaproteobacteria bacterium]|nr:histidinol phosphate phosphatase domain-containing protein [Deltaproteobacteria bacterium]NIS76931.1 histidinol phosphate phosphatase domain-containing protein [Deltaproteobacteria bacterium]